MRQLLKRLNGRNLAIALMVIPIVACAAYLYAFAADRYVSESVMTVKQSGSDQAIGLSGLASIFQISGASAHGDLLLLQTHIQSMDMLQLLEKQLHLRDAFSAPGRDVLLRLRPGASDDDFLSYYRDRVDAHLDDTTGLLTLRTQGFTSDQAQMLNKAIVAASEDFINQIGHRLARDQMNFASNELGKASDKFQNAKKKMLAFQEKHQMLDPLAQAKANSMLTTELQARLAMLEADLSTVNAYMDDNSFQVRAMRQQIDAVKKQLGNESARGTTSSGGRQQLGAVVGEYRELEIELNFAEQAYKSAILTMETARLESIRKMKSTVMVASPTKPQEAEYPRRAYDLTALMLAFALVYGIVRLMIATIEDHID